MSYKYEILHCHSPHVRWNLRISKCLFRPTREKPYEFCSPMPTNKFLFLFWNSEFYMHPRERNYEHRFQTKTPRNYRPCIGLQTIDLGVGGFSFRRQGDEIDKIPGLNMTCWLYFQNLYRCVKNMVVYSKCCV